MSCAFRRKRPKNRDKSFVTPAVPPELTLQSRAHSIEMVFTRRITVQPAVDAYWKFVRVALVSPFKTAFACAFTLPRLSGTRYAIFTSLTHRFTGRQQTDLLFEPMILQSPQNVNTVLSLLFRWGNQRRCASSALFKSCTNCACCFLRYGFRTSFISGFLAVTHSVNSIWVRVPVR